MKVLVMGELVLTFVIAMLLILFVIERVIHIRQVSELTSKLMSKSFSEFSIYNNKPTVDDKQKWPKPVVDQILGTQY